MHLLGYVIHLGEHPGVGFLCQGSLDYVVNVKR